MQKNGVRYVCLERKKGFKALLLFVEFLLFHIVLDHFYHLIDLRLFFF